MYTLKKDKRASEALLSQIREMEEANVADKEIERKTEGEEDTNKTLTSPAYQDSDEDLHER